MTTAEQTELPELPPGYSELNADEIAEARRIEAIHRLQKQREAEERELMRRQFCHDYGFNDE